MAQADAVKLKLKALKQQARQDQVAQAQARGWAEAAQAQAEGILKRVSCRRCSSSNNKMVVQVQVVLVAMPLTILATRRPSLCWWRTCARRSQRAEPVVPVGARAREQALLAPGRSRSRTASVQCRRWAGKCRSCSCINRPTSTKNKLVLQAPRADCRASEPNWR